MPKIGGEIPDWFDSIKYPESSDAEEFAFQIHLRQFIKSRKWLFEKENINSVEAMDFFRSAISGGMGKGSSFEKLKNSASKYPSKGVPVWWSRIYRSIGYKRDKFIFQLPDEKPFNHHIAICPNLCHSDKEILDAVKKALKEIRKNEEPFITTDWSNHSNENKALINSVYSNPKLYLQKWESSQVLHAFDLSIWRLITGKKILQSQIVNRLNIGDESRFRKTTQLYIKEISSQGVVDALVQAINDGQI